MKTSFLVLLFTGLLSFSFAQEVASAIQDSISQDTVLVHQELNTEHLLGNDTLVINSKIELPTRNGQYFLNIPAETLETFKKMPNGGKARFGTDMDSVTFEFDSLTVYQAVMETPMDSSANILLVDLEILPNEKFRVMFDFQSKVLFTPGFEMGKIEESYPTRIEVVFRPFYTDHAKGIALEWCKRIDFFFPSGKLEVDWH